MKKAFAAVIIAAALAASLTASTRHPKNLRTPFKSLTSILFNSRTIDNDDHDSNQLQAIADLSV